MLCQHALLLDKDTGSFSLQRTLGISPAKTNEVLKSKPHLHKVGDGISQIWKAKFKDVKTGCSRGQTDRIIVLYHDKSTHRPSKDSHFTFALYKKER